MAAVQSSRASKYACRGLMEDEPPDHLESAGEVLIKQLVQKQTNTHTTLEQQLQEEKKFERGVGFVSLNELLVGTSSLQQFEERKQLVERVGELEGRGLTREEALAMVQGGRQSKAVPDAQEAEQKYINQLLHKESCSLLPPSANQDHEKRQDWEQALSVKPNSLETRLYHFAMKNAMIKPQADLRPSDHPIHHLAAMEKRLLQTADLQTTARTIRRKRRQQLEALAEPQTVKYKVPDRLHTLWDAIETPQIVSKKPDYQKKKATCKAQVMYTIREGKIVELCKEGSREVVKDSEKELKSKPNGQAFVSFEGCDSVDIRGKLSEDEIRKLPRFQNYQRGTVSKVLYIKNLSDCVTETELAAVFDQFQEANERKIIFRLMTGKMRGQAFITFASCEKATAALQTVNGTILRGKPMVIQYGRQQD